MPYSGFEGDYVNPKTGANAYVRKHKYRSPCQLCPPVCVSF